MEGRCALEIGGSPREPSGVVFLYGARASRPLVTPANRVLRVSEAN
jgi:hypothetical protein